MNIDRGPAVETKLEALQLHVWYGSHHALRGIDIAVTAGKTLAIIGASGSGKTTLLRALNRLHDLTASTRVEGSVKLDGSEILGQRTDTAALRRRVAMIFPKPTVLPTTVFDNVVFGLRAKGVRDEAALAEKCERALRRALLWEQVANALDAPAGNLTSALLQRLCLARALALDPEVLLFDDPTASLDPVAGAALEEVIMPLRRDHTVLLATNNLEQAARLSDATCYLANGEVVETGETPLIFSRPADVRTEDFLAGRPSA
ncbi:MAG TPA: ATP-binding cassette domain-containing protein [Candidatus Eremiobacteraceae bacterium]|nr:ATP-binding cassette domain-containing protein [Candidatus Eremiobacteraceae bacterium]